MVVFEPAEWSGRFDVQLPLTKARVGHFLIPAPAPDDAVVMDDLANHQNAAVGKAVRTVGTHLLILPLCSQNLNSAHGAQLARASTPEISTPTPNDALQFSLPSPICSPHRRAHGSPLHVENRNIAGPTGSTRDIFRSMKSGHLLPRETQRIAKMATPSQRSARV